VIQTFKALAGLLPDPVLLLSREGMVLAMNGAASEHLGAPASALEGRPLRELVGEGAELDGYLARCLRSTAPLAGVVVMRVRGERIRCEGARVPGSDGRVLLRLARSDRVNRFALLSEKIDELNHEILQRREAEAQRESLIEELARAVRLSELFVAVLGHDLRNPLSAVLAGAGLALRRAEDPQIRAQLERVLRSAKRMGRMVDQLLDVTRVRLGRGLSLERGPMDLCELVHQVAVETEPAHTEQRIDVHVDGPCSGEWDRDRLAQVLSNLLANACQHSDPGSAVTVTISGTATDATVAVHNGGAPIPPELLPSVFDAFSGSETSQGLGLGLYIAREIARAHGGRVDVASSQEAGTIFTLTLPRAAVNVREDRNTAVPELVEPPRVTGAPAGS
jgi:signal transduction histidine kinase